MNDKHKTNKSTAALIVLFIFLMYMKTVWDPYFHPERYTQKTEQGAEGNPVVTQPVTNTGQSAVLSTVASAKVEALAKTEVDGINNKIIEEAGTINVETDMVIAEITLLGGRLKRLELKDHKLDVSQPNILMDLINLKEGDPLPLGLYQGTESDELVKYELVWEGQEAKQKDGVYVLGFSDKIKLVLRGQLPNGRQVVKTIAFNKGSYVMDVSFDVAGSSEPVKLEWTRDVPDKKEEAGRRPDGEFVWFDGTKVLRKNFAGFRKEAHGSGGVNYENLGSVTWLAMGELYFNEILISQSGTEDGEIMHDGSLFRIRLVSNTPSASYRAFAGPKQYDILKRYGSMLEKNVNLGQIGFLPSGFATLIAAPMLMLLNLFYKASGNYGVAIIALTIFVKLITFPINISSLKHMKIMSELQPEVKAIQERMKENKDPNALMEFYKKKGVNPMGGCLPAFIQIPFFIGLYSALYTAFELRHAPFALWIKDLSASEALMISGIPVPMLVVLFTVFMLVQQWLTPSVGDPTQKKVMMVVPLFFGFILAKLPAGLTLYMLVSSIVSVAQQKVYNRTSSAKDALVASVACSIALICLGIIFTKLN